MTATSKLVRLGPDCKTIFTITLTTARATNAWLGCQQTLTFDLQRSQPGCFDHKAALSDLTA